jgi:hypothetical protein
MAQKDGYIAMRTGGNTWAVTERGNLGGVVQGLTFPYFFGIKMPGAKICASAILLFLRLYPKK